jgi:hypothetical protein
MAINNDDTMAGQMMLPSAMMTMRAISDDTTTHSVTAGRIISHQ